jgi:tetratricopeptide (TPR) repeat protein/transcriptional regulator with XRE-family HTH domain
MRPGAICRRGLADAQYHGPVAWAGDGDLGRASGVLQVVTDQPAITFGVLLRQLRARAKLTQEELAEAAGLSPRSVSDLERGINRTARKETALLLAGALSLTGQARALFIAAARGRAPASQVLAAGPGSTVSAPEDFEVPRLKDAGPASSPPRQLPSAARLVGRVAELAALHGLLGQVGEMDGTVVIAVISGMAGVGKTALAVHFAHKVAARFPDGQLYVNLRGFDPSGQPVTPGVAIRGFLDAMEVPTARMPTDLNAQIALYRSLLAGRRMLIVADNASDVAQVRPLLPGAAGCLVLVTSRRELTGLAAADGARPVGLQPLSSAEARELMAARLGQGRVAAEPEAVTEIIAACGRLPLALAIVAAQATVRPSVCLQALVAGLRAGRLGALAAGDDPATDIEAVFSWSYRSLTPPAARLFRLMSLHPGADLSATAAASLAGVPLAAAHALLAELAAAHLTSEPVPGRYALHDLLRAYACRRAEACDTRRQRQAASLRALDHYLHTAHAADQLLHPYREPMTLGPPAPGVTPVLPADHDQGLAWFVAERPVLLAAVGHAAETGLDTHAWQLAWAVRTFLDLRGHWQDQITVQRLALAAAQRLADPWAQALAHSSLANAYTRLRRFGDAESCLERSLELYGQAGDLARQARTHLNLAIVAERQGRSDEVLGHSEQALEFFQVAGHRQGTAEALNAMGWSHLQIGDHRQAIAYCRQALALHQELGDRQGQANTWDSLGAAHLRLGQHGPATTCYQRALDLFRDLGDRYYQADALTHLGDARHGAGDTAAARDAWQQAVAIFSELDSPEAGQVRAKLTILDGARPEKGKPDAVKRVR